MRIPFVGKGLNIRQEDIQEGDLTYRLPTRLPIIDYDITNSEEMEEKEIQEINNGENIEEDELFEEENEAYNNDERQAGPFAEE